MSKFKELRQLDVGAYIEKKNNLSYLSWSWAVDVLLQNDPMATWQFYAPHEYGETKMVRCTVTAFGKTIEMHLPVMDNRNQAIKNPDAVQVNKAMMRCLAKAIACFGIGLYIYSGEDLPTETVEPVDVEKIISSIKASKTLEELKTAFTAGLGECGSNKQAMLQINAAKDARKAELVKG